MHSWCVCLKTPYVVDSLTLKSQPTVLQLTPAWSLSSKDIFSLRYITAFSSLLVLKNTRQPLSTMLGGHFKQQNHFLKKKAQQKDKHSTNQIEEEHLFAIWELKQEGLVHPQLGTWTQATQIFHCACLWMTSKAQSIDFRVTNKY